MLEWLIWPTEEDSRFSSDCRQECPDDGRCIRPVPGRLFLSRLVERRQKGKKTPERRWGSCGPA